MQTLNAELTRLNTNVAALNKTRESRQTRHEHTFITALGMTVGLLMSLYPDSLTTITTTLTTILTTF
jgi:hypothetical protein